MKSLLYLLIFFILIFLLVPGVVYADDFDVKLVATYKINSQGELSANFSYSIENLKAEVMMDEFHVNFVHLDPVNISVQEGNKKLSFTTSKEQNSIYLKVLFDDKVYGLGKKRLFEINFDEKNISKKTGNIIEVSIPKLNADDLDSFESVLVLPATVGPLAYIRPDTYTSYKNEDSIVYRFEGKDVSQTGINATFGEFQIFDFTLNYNIENTAANWSDIDVAVPPDTAYQRIFITNSDPLPVGSRVDNDGNWIFSYRLAPFEKKTVTLQGSAQVFSYPRSLAIPPPQSIIKNLSNTDYWQVDSYPIKELAMDLKTPERIYDYVVKNLKYDFSRVDGSPNRLGATKALSAPYSALCTEFTDLFIAISRSAGIPAREIQGYAYTQNSKTQPLSLVSDVLHAWPQYWDSDRRAWISVDPTWESTTGIDYFNKFDMNHLAFVIHGEDDRYPLPAGSYKFSDNPKKDVFVRFGEFPSSEEKINISHTLKSKYNLFSKKFEIAFTNSGNVALYNLDYEIKYDSTNISDKGIVETLIPFEKFEKSVDVNYGFLAKKAPKKIIVSYRDKFYEIDTQADAIAISQVIFFLASIFLILLVFYLLHRRNEDSD